VDAVSDIVDDETLAIAVKKAIDVGLIPKVGFIDDVAENWEKVKAVTEIVAAEVSRRFEADLKRAHTVYDICREALEAEHHRASLAEMERDAILRWSIRHAGYLGTREDTDGEGRWWARGDEGRVVADTAEAVVRKAAGLEPEPASWDDE
jgi:hypothetical protein